MEWKVAPSYKDGKILEVNEKERKALVALDCPRCGGKGIVIARVENNVPIPIPVDGGICYKCNGKGHLTKLVKAYTPEEYDKYMASQERARARKEAQKIAKYEELQNKSEENKAIWLAENGFEVEDPAVYLVVGNTYEIKDIIKERGGRYNPVLNWYFMKETEVPSGYYLAKVPFDKVFDWYPQTKRASVKDKSEIKDLIDEAKAAVMPESTSEYVGSIKERLRDMRVTLTGCRAITTAYGESILFTFDYNGNTLVWFTSTVPDEEKTVVGNEYILTGTVKDFKLYNGVKQTYLNRCIIKVI